MQAVEPDGRGFESQVKGMAGAAGHIHEFFPLCGRHPTAPLHLKGRNTQAAYQKAFPRDPFPQRAHSYSFYPLPPPKKN